MNNNAHLYLDAEALRERGWTETLIGKFLGKPDKWVAVDHFRNYTGKRTWFLEDIEAIEGSDEFEAAFRASTRRRKLDAPNVAAMREKRVETRGQVETWRSSITEEDIRVGRALAKAARLIKEARSRGYRTPNK